MYKYLVLILFLLTGCKDDVRGKILNSVVNRIEKKVNNKNITIVGLGEGLNHANNKQNYLKIVFEVDEVATIEGGRKLFFELLNDVLYEVNNTPHGELAFDKFPISAEFPEIVIFCKKDLTGLSSIKKYSDKSLILYSERDSDLESFHSHIIYEESLNEAKNKNIM